MSIRRVAQTNDPNYNNKMEKAKVFPATGDLPLVIACRELALFFI